MDPITLGRLLSVADAIEVCRNENRLDVLIFEQIVAEQSKAKDMGRRVRDILRVLAALKWIRVEGEGPLYLTANFDAFISAWNVGDLLSINCCLAEYEYYKQFLDFLSINGAVPMPNTKAKERKLGAYLKQNYGITFVAFDTFWRWALATGYAYLSPFSYSLYWGGNWSRNHPTTETFRSACWESYVRADKTSGYANVGRLADVVCRNSGMSFQAFAMKLNDLIEVESNLIKFAPSTIREPTRDFFKIATVKAREKVLSERISVRLLGVKKRPLIPWIVHRYVEDGVYINGQLVKLIRWEAEP